MTEDRASRIPVTVLTGFLGAGKTTLLNRLLALPAMAGAAVLVNEFGEIGIDHLLVERVEGDMLMLTTGCLCCAARGDLVGALAGLLERRRAGLARFDRIVIETTGLADPGPVINALLPTPELGSACGLDQVVTVVDALAGAETLDRMEEARRQVALADLLVVSKADCLSSDAGATPAGLHERLRALNPTAPLCLAGDLDAVTAALDRPETVVEARRQPAQGGHRHLHGIHSVILRAGRIDLARFEMFLDLLIAGHGANLLRLKGLVASAADPERPLLVNVVQHRIHPAARLEAWPDADRTTRLVAIAAGGAAGIAALWDGVFGPPRIDQADAAALSLGLDRRPGLF